MRGAAALAVIGLIAAATGIAGCSTGAGAGPAGAKPFDAMSAEEHFACAVDISAYAYLMAGGTLPKDRELAGQAALAAAWHHNAYAVPPGAGEPHDRVNRERAAADGQGSTQGDRGPRQGLHHVRGRQAPVGIGPGQGA